MAERPSCNLGFTAKLEAKNEKTTICFFCFRTDRSKFVFLSEMLQRKRVKSIEYQKSALVISHLRIKKKHMKEIGRSASKMEQQIR